MASWIMGSGTDGLATHQTGSSDFLWGGGGADGGGKTRGGRYTGGLGP